MIKTLYASSLPEFYKTVDMLSERSCYTGTRGNDSCKQPEKYWFRGHKYNHYNLLPTLFRDHFPKCNSNQTYGEINLKEDYRYQHFKARTYHEIDTKPELKSEWQEIYQHHFGNTRMMDWSESARTALTFALEPYIDTAVSKELEYKRRSITPVVWVLNPYMLNKKVYEFWGTCPENYMKSALADLELNDRWAVIRDEMKEHEDLYFSTGGNAPEMDGVLSLCVLEKYRETLGARLKSLVSRLEFNPYHYMVLRYYTDALPVLVEEEDSILPPLAILHPYHSERIRNQRGAFTVFPNYMLSAFWEHMAKDRKIDIRTMERQTYIRDCLACISIVDPHNVARQLILSGERKTELYPDVQDFAYLLETRKYYY